MTVKLKPSEIAALHEQLFTLSKHELPGKEKFNIYKNMEVLDPISSPYIKTQQDLFKKYGELKDGKYFIPEFVGAELSTINENFTKYNEEVESLDTPVDVSLTPISKDILAGDKPLSGNLLLIYKYLLQ